LKNSSCWQNK